MAKLTFGIESAVGNTSRDSSILTDQQMSRFLDYIWDTYPHFEADGTTRKTRNNANLAASFQDWAEALWEGTKANVFQYERLKAVLTAEDGVTEIDA